MKLLKELIIVYICTFVCISLICINIINIVQIKEALAVTLNFSLLFFKGTYELLYYILIVSFIPCIGVLFNTFFSNSNYNKKNYNKLMTTAEAKKELLRVDFNDRQFIESPLAKIKYIFKDKKTWMIGDELKTKRSGFPIVTSKNTIWLDPSDSHNMVIGTTNSGKTYSILFEMIELTRLAGESAIIVDLKGELSKATAQKFIDDGYDCICIDFINPEKSESWNPLELGKIAYFKEKERVAKYVNEMTKKIAKLRKVHYAKYGNSVPFVFNEKNENGDPILDENNKVIEYANYSKAEEYFYDVANTIYDYEGNGDNQHWYISASELMLGCIYFLAETGNPDYVNLEAVKRLVDLGDTIYEKKETYLQRALKLTRKQNDLSSIKLVEYTDVAENTRKSIKSVFGANLSQIIRNQDVKNMLASNSIDLEKIGDRKTVIFLKVHDEKSIYYPLINLFMSQVYEVLIANARKNKDLKLKVPLNILWDEFGSSPKFEPILNLLSAGRSRGIRCTLVVQGYDQLESKYGKEGARSIKNNVMNKVYLLSGDEETLKEFSNLAGKKEVWHNGKHEEEPLFSTERLSKFQLGEALFIRQRKNPFYTKLLPYNKYAFYSTENSTFETKNRPTAKCLNIIDYVDNGNFKMRMEYMKRMRGK